ncbi:hypothetical protein CC80DRAFT_536706 [Byssothecium circinans]|uniref:Transmembrane protein n=1 Tax=Byssothecium circinans TaxID=147558 RepID=A0A6A5TQK1_9PLEO|nr:hypothetical protein CC80DRAFT_536706 [Byssothecium circinans]
MPINCTAQHVLKANPDVSGKGVLIAFVATAYLILFFCASSYLLCDSVAIPTRIDKMFLDSLWRPANGRGGSVTHSRHPSLTEKSLNEIVLAFSDQQIVTGIAILISGFVQIEKGLSTHHWANIVNLAWFSSVSHLTTLTMLRKYLQKKKRLWRLIGMALMLVMLACGMGSLGYYYKAAHPAWCLFRPNDWKKELMTPPYYNSIYVGCALTVIGLGYVARVILLYPSTSDSIKKKLEKYRIGIDGYLVSQHARIPKSARPIPVLWRIYYKICCSFYVLAVLAIDLYSSMLWEITWLGFTLVWGTVRLFRERNFIQQTNDTNVGWDENIWGFGQVLPIVLLALPFASAYEAMNADFYDEDDKNDSPSSTPPRTSPQAFTVLNPLDECSFDLYSTPWFSKVVILQYGLSLTVLCDAIYFFSYDLGTWDLTYQPGIIVADYAIWLSINFGIVWVFTLVCADSDLHILWFNSSLGRRLSQGFSCIAAWTIPIVLLIGASVAYVIQMYTNPSLICVVWKNWYRCPAKTS